MEIEAKYTASGPVKLVGLMKADKLGDYRLRTIADKDVVDHYVDTPDRDLMKAGYVCRIRESGDQVQAAVKGLGGAEGCIHRREEYETEIQPDALPPQWPDSKARDMVISLSQSKPLAELCVITQLRTLRSVILENRRVGTMSLDIVNMQLAGKSKRIYEVEIELEEGGNIEDLNVLDVILRAYGLHPETLSKFERAMDESSY